LSRKSPETIADELEEGIENVQDIISVIEAHLTEEFDAEKVYEEWKKHSVAV
jgi:hypothetical protein